MHTIRGRLAVSYAVALGATMFVFALVVYLVQRGENLEELDARARLASNLIAATMSEAYRARGSLVVRDPRTNRDILAPDVAPFLEGIPGYVVVVGSGEDVLHVSADARALTYGSLVLLLGRAYAADSGATVGAVDVGPPAGVIRYFARPVTDAGPEVGAVLSGAATTALVIGPQRLLLVIGLLSPVILLASIAIGYLLAGRTLRPLLRIVDEVEAISDGRSLHKRLAPLETGDELARLTNQLNEMLARLERSFASLRRFTADASHELKTPLTVLRSGVERAITHPRVTPEVMEVLDETLGEVNRMTEIVESLLVLARADEGRAPLHRERLDLRELLAEVAETGGLLGEQAAVDVRVSMPTVRIELWVDRMRIRQLLLNLLTNAIKYTPAGGRVDIRTEILQSAELSIEVRDTGVGIAPGDLPHIFDRFWRADAARSRGAVRPGVGLGLAICQWVAEAHGGTISARSSRNRGTTMTVKLPMGAEPVADEVHGGP
ncbi:MAG: HAMP domain-containing histidine kinase [Gemmatimonadota bacterium]|nr:HAMP domain-containing histidine kinase [Gemmatimonadota bacterium]